MKTVYKYQVELDSVKGSHHRVSIPTHRGAKPLCVMVQNGIEAYVWCEVDTDMPRDSLTLKVIGTGHGEVPEGGKYLGSVIQGPYVWHVYY